MNHAAFSANRTFGDSQRVKSSNNGCELALKIGVVVSGVLLLCAAGSGGLVMSQLVGFSLPLSYAIIAPSAGVPGLLLVAGGGAALVCSRPSKVVTPTFIPNSSNSTELLVARVLAAQDKELASIQYEEFPPAHGMRCEIDAEKEALKKFRDFVDYVDQSDRLTDLQKDRLAQIIFRVPGHGYGELTSTKTYRVAWPTRKSDNPLHNARYFHGTAGKSADQGVANFSSILDSKKIREQKQGTFSGAFVSDFPVERYGPIYFGLNRGIEQHKPLRSGFNEIVTREDDQRGRGYFAGFQTEAPVTTETLECVVYDESKLTPERATQLKKECAERKIPLYTLTELKRARTADPILMIPNMWPDNRMQAW